MAVSIQTSLIRTFILLIFLLTITIMIVLGWGSRRVVDDLDQKLVDQALNQTEDAMHHYFGSIEELLDASNSWWESGILKYEGPEDLVLLNSIFTPKLDQHDQITSMMAATEEGFEYLLFRDASGGSEYEWYNRIIWADKGPEAGFVAKWKKDMTPYSSEPLRQEDHDYDPRNRPYYLLPGLDTIHWTRPYYFFISKDAGITAVKKWKNTETQQMRLLAFDLMLSDLSHFTSELRPTENGSVFIVDTNGSILGLPADSRWPSITEIKEIMQQPAEAVGGPEADAAAQLPDALDLGIAPVNDAIAHWKDTGEPANELFRYRSQGAVWFNEMRPFDLGGLQLWIGVVIPEDDLLAEAKNIRNLVLLISFLAIVLSVYISFRLSRRYGKPLRFLADQSESVRHLNLVDKGSIQSGIKEVDQLSYAQTQMMTALDSFSKYVPLDLVRELLDRGEVAEIGGRNEELTILFSDVANFTSISESLSPEDLTSLMAEYFEVLLEVMHDKHATVDKFIGDSIMAFWGAPSENEHHATDAIDATLECKARIETLNAEWQARGLPVLHTRFGLSTGNAVVGNVGAPERLNYTVLGDTVNTASRVEALNRYYGTIVLATETTKALTGDRYVWRIIDAVRVKGKNISINVFEPMGRTDQVPDDIKKLASQYSHAFAVYRESKFTEAIDLLKKILATWPDDSPTQVLLERCQEFVANPPGKDWDGISHYEKK